MDRHIIQVVERVRAGARKATKYVAPSLTIKASRQHKRRGNERAVTIILTIGRPNYAERRFIKACQKAGEPFPVRRVQTKAFAQKRKTRHWTQGSMLSLKQQAAKLVYQARAKNDAEIWAER